MQPLFFITNAKIKITLLLDVTPCSLVEYYEYFGTALSTLNT
jgi:hypothetical protein